ncbi:MAG: hypothetical protein ABJB86_21655, partial [Bacteroidota bacterium]
MKFLGSNGHSFSAEVFHAKTSNFARRAQRSSNRGDSEHEYISSFFSLDSSLPGVRRAKPKSAISRDVRKEAAIAEIPNTLAVFLCVRRSVASAARNQNQQFHATCAKKQ